MGREREPFGAIRLCSLECTCGTDEQHSGSYDRGKRERENVTINCVKWVFQTTKVMALWAWGSGLFKAQGRVEWAQAKESAWIKILLSEHNEKVIHEPLHSKCRWICGQHYLETSKTTWMKYSLVLEKGTGEGGGGCIYIHCENAV